MGWKSFGTEVENLGDRLEIQFEWLGPEIKEIIDHLESLGAHGIVTGSLGIVRFRINCRDSDQLTKDLSEKWGHLPGFRVG
jgi:hypothetical protein